MDAGGFKDAPDTNPLEAPETHSFHCLLDVDVCVASGYEILGDRETDDGLYCRAYTIEDNTPVLEYARARGDYSAGGGTCTTCTENDIEQAQGLRATIKGTRLNNGNIAVSEVLDAGAGCGDIPVADTTCHAGNPLFCFLNLDNSILWIKISSLLFILFFFTAKNPFHIIIEPASNLNKTRIHFSAFLLILRHFEFQITSTQGKFLDFLQKHFFY